MSEPVDLKVLTDVYRKLLEFNSPECMNALRPDGSWLRLSGLDIRQRVTNIARALLRWNIAPGDRVAILSENRHEWSVVDYATLLIGAVDVPIYPTLTAEQIAFILHDSGCRIAFVSTADQMNKVLAIRQQTKLEKIIVMDDVGHPDVVSMSSLMLSDPYAPWPDLDERALRVSPEDLCTIIYTSGTTGRSKGVMLTHRNLCSNIQGSMQHFQYAKESGYISFLPLSHITARHVDYSIQVNGLTITHCSHFEDVAKLLQLVRPHNLVAVPRVYEKIRQEVERQAHRGFKRLVFDWALRVGKEHRDEICRGITPNSFSWNLANRLVFKKISAGMGNATCRISGGAPLGFDTAAWFADVGLRIFEGYGMTETSPVISLNNATHYKLGTVGHPLPNVECKIAEDGELLVCGPSVFSGYWNLPEETQQGFVDGWFMTGDIGNIDSDGFLSITDRKKDLIKTSGGKFIAPQPIENKLKANVLVAQAAIIGEKRKFVSVLISPHFPLLEDWANVNGVKFKDRSDLIANEKVRALFEGIVTDVNLPLAQFERLKQVLLVPDEFTITTGELTPSLKLKRRVVEQKYSGIIEAMYQAAERHKPEHHKH